MANQKSVSVILPCLNEEKTVGICVEKAKKAFRENRINGEIIVVDNNSTDKSSEIAEKAGAIVVREKQKGYGSAYLAGIEKASGEIIIFADADCTYDLMEMPLLISEMKNADMVIGKRNIQKGAMPWLHRYVGNPALSFILRKFFNVNISDTHCGFRAARKNALKKLSLQSTGMEFASEMIIKASKAGLIMKEIPVTYNPRVGESKLSSFTDGWRHLRFMFLYSPLHLFILPGLLLFIIGLYLLVSLLNGPMIIDGFKLDMHPMVLGEALVLVGFQIMSLGIYAKSYAIKRGLDMPKGFMLFIEKHLNFERGMLSGLLIMLAGLLMGAVIITRWVGSNFGELNELRSSIFAMTFIILGVQIMFSSFFLSVLGIEKR